MKQMKLFLIIYLTQCIKNIILFKLLSSINIINDPFTLYFHMESSKSDMCFIFTALLKRPHHTSDGQWSLVATALGSVALKHPRMIR